MIQRKAYQYLEVWKEAMNLITSIYKEVKIESADSPYLDLGTSILERAIQIPLWIEFSTDKDGYHESYSCLCEANSSCAVVRYYLILCRDLEFLNIEVVDCLLEKIEQLIIIIEHMKDEDEQSYKNVF
ncbi:four helix bundle protein [Myroides sp. M-43]|uniref:four helix bundle protein n=1 Tax=Myroides oncorhynchi TaxID=2893756 RepID=UPI001E3AFEB8|nr:four helix bundle protein [Myroides oncorhynchi]MCC9044264.1 four helix bundle protein [Myroides oncorhynchi]